MNTQEADCKECGTPIEDGTGLNGYCDGCTDKFIAKEKRGSIDMGYPDSNYPQGRE